MTNFGEVNNGFIRATINVFTKDQVANGFEFQEEGIEKRRKNWAYVPVVAEYIDTKEDMGSHGGKLTISDEGVRYERTTIPMGVAIADTDRFEDVVCMNGETKRYFCMDVYLWHDQFKRELDMFVKGESRPQSMEVKILDSEFVDGVEKVYDFEPLAMCILGCDIPPAFKDSKVKIGFQSDEFKANFDKMIFALDKYIESFEKGGDDVEEEIKVEEATTEELEQEVEVTVETEVEDVVQEVEVEAEVETQEMANEEEDSDEESEEDMARKKRAKCEDESSEEVDETDYKAEYELIKVELEQAKVEMSELQEKFNTISKEYQAKIDAETLAEKQKVIASYSDSLTEEEINSVITDVTTFSVEDVDTKLAAYLGKKIKQDKSKQEDTTVFSNLETNFANNSKWSGWLSKM